MRREMLPSSASNASRERHQSGAQQGDILSDPERGRGRVEGESKGPLPWDPDLEEAADQPPHLILLDPSFLVYRGRRRKRTSSST